MKKIIKYAVNILLALILQLILIRNNGVYILTIICIVLSMITYFFDTNDKFNIKMVFKLGLYGIVYLIFWFTINPFLLIIGLSGLTLFNNFLNKYGNNKKIFFIINGCCFVLMVIFSILEIPKVTYNEGIIFMIIDGLSIITFSYIFNKNILNVNFRNIDIIIITCILIILVCNIIYNIIGFNSIINKNNEIIELIQNCNTKNREEVIGMIDKVMLITEFREDGEAGMISHWSSLQGLKEQPKLTAQLLKSCKDAIYSKKMNSTRVKEEFDKYISISEDINDNMCRPIIQVLWIVLVLYGIEYYLVIKKYE